MCALCYAFQPQHWPLFSVSLMPPQLSNWQPLVMHVLRSLQTRLLPLHPSVEEVVPNVTCKPATGTGAYRCIQQTQKYCTCGGTILRQCFATHPCHDSDCKVSDDIVEADMATFPLVRPLGRWFVRSLALAMSAAKVVCACIMARPGAL